MKKMDPVVHFEMPYVDKSRMADFYVKTFGWKAEMLGPEMGEYVVVATAEMTKDNMPTKMGTIGGGFYKKPEGEMGQHPSVVIAVVDIKESMQKIEQGGGKIFGEPMEIPGIGMYVSFQDTEGNRVSILQPSQKM